MPRRSCGYNKIEGTAPSTYGELDTPISTTERSGGLYVEDFTASDLLISAGDLEIYVFARMYGVTSNAAFNRPCRLDTSIGMCRHCLGHHLGSTFSPYRVVVGARCGGSATSALQTLRTLALTPAGYPVAAVNLPRHIEALDVQLIDDGPMQIMRANGLGTA